MLHKRHVLVAGFLLIYWCSHGCGLSRLKRQNSNCDIRSNFLCPSGECLAKAEICDGKEQCSDGADETVLSCDCGTSLQATDRSNGNAEGVRDAGKGTRPWHVGIYMTRFLNHHSLLCSGVLIYSDIVITSASCVFDVEVFRTLEANTLKVSAGKLKRDFSIDESNQQNFNVSEVVVLDRYDGDIKGYARNLALLRLNRAARTDVYVRPICLWGRSDLPPRVSKVTITGWGLQFKGNFGANLREATVDSLDVSSCLKSYSQPLNKRFLTHDKFCILFNQGVGMKGDDTGGPVSFVHEGRHYLMGVLSVKVPSVTTFGLATKLSKYISWIHNTTYNLKLSARCTTEDFECEGQCVSKFKVCDGHRDCFDGSDELPANCLKKPSLTALEGERCELPDDRAIYEVSDCKSPTGCDKVSVYAPHLTSFKVRCPLGYGFEDPQVGQLTTICVDGKWHPEIRNPCLRLCQPVSSKSLQVKCRYRGQDLSCAQALRPYTEVHIECRPHYLRKPQTYFVNQTSCRTDGRLEHVLTNCSPVCGVQNDIDKAQTLISGGQEAKPGKYPWHTALYWYEHEEWAYKCGGTIIDSNKVLTAAHCLFLNSRGTIISEKSVSVISGKLHSSWLYRDPWEQRRGVSKIIPGEFYNGGATNQAQDIAVLILDRDLSLNAYNLPACLDLDSSRGGLPATQLGHVAGWGREQSDVDKNSEVLKETTLKYLDLESCRQRYNSPDFRRFLSSDKFCVIYSNGSGAQMGDSGGGITFIHDELHYVYGVVSLKPATSNEYAVFTDVLRHKAWLENILATEQ